MTTEVVPATVDRWDQVEAVLGGPRSRPDSCWCRRFLGGDPDHRAALRREIADAPDPIGLLALVDGEPAGWSRVVPRRILPGVLGNRAIARRVEPDPDAWWVTCFVVRRAARGSGVGQALLEAGVDWAEAHGASSLDGHPVDVPALKGKPSPAALFTGTLAMFERAGFQEVGRTSPTRPLMRLTFR